ncbi:DUF4268 domain-containing protein [Sorangium sp. KYC3313]|uniref:DUF4268 domain-containing protein n=1 Tax=Sorangium sp. KYC3313 TaxID=3449740 RepID=UPI003F88E34D
MPAVVSDLLQGKAKPVTVTQDEPIGSALAQMIRYDYSQLPVVGGDDRCVAILTADAIARTLNNFGVAPDALRVFDAMDERVVTCRDDDDLLDVLDDLHRNPAVLVLAPHEALIGIITSHDTTEYFRRRAQDIMLVQDIEETVKDYVLLPFKNGGDEVNQDALRSAIDSITPSNLKELRGPFNKAIGRYLELRDGADAKVDSSAASTAFQEHLYRKEAVKPFDKLSLNEYIELFVSMDRWPSYEPVLRIKREALRRLLWAVRDTRNDLAHFRIDISEQQRDELRFCRDWLVRHQEAVTEAFAASSAPQSTAAGPGEASPPPGPPPPGAGAAGATGQPPPVPPVEETDQPDGSRYGRLNAWMRTWPASQDRVSVSFAEIENVLGGKLPASAREHRSWWGNNATGHAQSKQWLDAGWRVVSVSSRGETVTFARNKEREAAYIAFYNDLIRRLQHAGAAPMQTSPIGASWFTFAPLPDVVPRIAYLNFSFARSKELRVELYIDSGDRAKNKSVFDALRGHKEEIEAALGEPLSWERMDEKRASRIALYYPGSITDEKGLDELRERAVAAMLRFQRIMSGQFAKVLGTNDTART